jgi:hypothetical protein
MGPAGAGASAIDGNSAADWIRDIISISAASLGAT